MKWLTPSPVFPLTWTQLTTQERDHPHRCGRGRGRGCGCDYCAALKKRLRLNRALERCSSPAPVRGGVATTASPLGLVLDTIGPEQHRIKQRNTVTM